jgi:hypothetical protein
MEADQHVEIAVTRLDGKTPAQALFQRERRPARESLAGVADGFDARGNERAEVVAQMIERKEKPFAVDVGEVIRIDEALLDAPLAGFALGQLQLLARGSGFGKGVEDLQVQDRLRGRAEGDGLRRVVKAEGDGIREGLLHLFEGAEQRSFEAGAAILLEGLLGYNEREDFAFRDLKRGKSLDGLSVKVAKPAAIVLDRKLQPVAHELEVAVNGLCAHFQLASKGAGIRIALRMQGPVNAQHALQGRAGAWRLNSRPGACAHPSATKPLSRAFNCAKGHALGGATSTSQRLR